MRQQITHVDIDNLVSEFVSEIARRLTRKGFDCLASRHEVLGVVTEEYHELCEAVHGQSIEQVRREAWDVAIAAVVGVLSIDKGVEW